jgi:hypothetical protein
MAVSIEETVWIKSLLARKKRIVAMATRETVVGRCVVAMG